MDLLEKASIILTPTAYNNGEALCVKPDDGSGDFDFSRNSAATRVNAQGLVENVQILSSNLVQNGDFSELGTEEVSNGSFSQEGSELVTNGSFDTDSDWTFIGTTEISGGVASFPDSTNSFLIQSNVVSASVKTYKITYDVVSTNGNNFRFAGGSSAFGLLDLDSATIGTKTAYVTSNGTNTALQFNNHNFIGSIDNVSVREVGQDWSLGTGWSIGEDKAVAVSGASTKLTQSISGLSGKICKVTLTLSDYGGNGSVRVDFGSVSSDPINTNGEHTIYGTYDNNAFELFKNTGFSGSITNISVKEVGQDWTLGTGWSIGENKAICEANGGFDVLNQGFVLNSGNSYKVTYTADLSLITSGTLKLGTFGNSVSERTILDGTNTAYLTASGTSFAINEGGAIGTATITNISVIEITDDTNLPRINYEGFSYQDALGSELVVNGDFSNGLSNWTNFNVSLVDGGANLNNIGLSGQITYIKQVGYVSGNSYKLELDVISTNGADLVLENASNTSIGTQTIGRKIVYFTQVNANSLTIKRLSGDTNVVIDNISVKEVIGQEVVPDSGCGSWLFEPQSTNLITYSEDFSDSSWIVQSGITITTNTTDTLSPSGLNNANKVVSTDNTRGFYSIPASTTNDVTRTIYLKGSVGGESVTLKDGGGFGGSVTHTLTTEWARYEFKTTNDGNIYKGLYVDDISVGTIYAWGAQLEQQSYATSYIPTEGSTVTRNQDVCINGGSLATINSTEGVLYAEIAALADDGTNRIICISDGTNGNRVQIYYSTTTNSLIGLVASGGLTVASLNTTLSNTTDITKVAVKYRLNDFALWVNGVEVAVDIIGNPPIGLDRLDFRLGVGILPFYGKTKALAVWKEALTDAELTSLTTI